MKYNDTHENIILKPLFCCKLKINMKREYSAPV